MKIVLVDAYDSFVHILKQYLLDLGAHPLVVRSDEFGPAVVSGFGADALLLGPGPGHPLESGHIGIVRRYAGRLPIMGVCLGHQAVGMAFGASVVRAPCPVHGKASRIEHDGQGLFLGLPAGLRAMRYHSLVVDDATLPGCLQVTARSEDGLVMGLRHRFLRIETTQFHPESVGTDFGHEMLNHFLDHSMAMEAAS